MVLAREYSQTSKTTNFRDTRVGLFLPVFQHGGIEYHLSHIFPMIPLDPPENIRKPKAFDVFSGYRKSMGPIHNHIKTLNLLLIRRTKT